ncbi:MAG: Gfo/Idh/MocA family oxidoreductase [Anaerolineales bacterium]|nr:Gfo/Idh/MocA family oxidoreductase [Anaerolineales bacterium]
MLQTAIIGGGFMGVTHTEALRRLRIPMIGMLGATTDETNSFVKRMGIPRAYESLDALAKDKDVNVVHLCTPNYLHYSMAKTLLEAGKHVLIEKPLADTSLEGAELVQLAKDKKLVGAVNYSVRFYPMNQEARARILAGQIGEPRILHAEYCQDWLFLPTDWNWRLVAQEGGALRVVGDIGTHVMDMLTWLTGLEIVEVMADMATFIPVRKRPLQAVETFGSKLSISVETEDVPIDTEDFASILLRFNNGARGVISLSQVNAGRKNAFWWEINGSKSSLQWHQEEPNKLWMGYREKPNEILLKDPALMQPDVRSYAAYPGGHAEGYPDTFVRYFSDVYRYISNGDFSLSPTFPTLEDGHQELLLCEAIQQSASEGRWVKVGR